jgi:hypothetical protein
MCYWYPWFFHLAHWIFFSTCSIKCIILCLGLVLPLHAPIGSLIYLHFIYNFACNIYSSMGLKSNFFEFLPKPSKGLCIEHFELQVWIICMHLWWKVATHISTIVVVTVLKSQVRLYLCNESRGFFTLFFLKKNLLGRCRILCCGLVSQSSTLHVG